MNAVLILIVTILGVRGAAMETLTREAVADWAVPVSMQVTVKGGADRPHSGGVLVAFTSYDASARPRTCDITVLEVFWTLTTAQQERIMRHEVGHCYGQQHHDGRGVMGPYWEDIRVSAEERLAAQRLFWKKRVMQMVAR